jgi:hypothetical protein
MSAESFFLPTQTVSSGRIFSKYVRDGNIRSDDVAFFDRTINNSLNSFSSGKLVNIICADDMSGIREVLIAITYACEQSYFIKYKYRTYFIDFK